MIETEWIDLTDVDMFVRGEHLAALAALRRHSPVHWVEGGDGSRFWALTRYEHVVQAYRDHTIFGSTRGAILGGSYGNDEDSAGGRMLVASDLPRHRLLKKQLQPALSASVVAAVTEQVRDLVAAAVDRAVADGGCDFATDVATELPAGALMVVFGIGHGEAHEMIRLTRRMIGFRDEAYVDVGDDAGLRLAWLQAEIFDFFAGLVTARKRKPGDDLVSVLLRAKINGRTLSEEDIFYNCMNVAVGGNETSSYTACTGLLALLEHPDQLERLLVEPNLLPSALDEILRWSSTNAYVQRVVRRNVELGGHTLHEGDSVTLWNVSANRDEDQFLDADTFDIGRTPNRHLAYGAGIHRCIGSPVGQTELTMMFERLIAAGRRFRLAGPPRRLRSNFILGITRLPLEVIG